MLALIVVITLVVIVLLAVAGGATEGSAIHQKIAPHLTNFAAWVRGPAASDKAASDKAPPKTTGAGAGADLSETAEATWSPDLAVGYPYSYSVGGAGPTSGLAERNRMYSSAEVDPLITGQLYAGERAEGAGRRPIYGGRTSHGNTWGMREFSTGVPGQAGVDVGLLGMREYSLDGKPDVFDDGIPENWQMPSTPMNWYSAQGGDHYDVEAGGPAVHSDHLMSLQEPDHDPLTS